MNSISKLVSISSKAVSSELLSFSKPLNDALSTAIGRELQGMLSERNGFFVFKQALQVYASDVSCYPNIADWNAQDGWRKQYKDLDRNLIFFAQDIFGVQFCISEFNVSTFDPETGKIEEIASSITEWASLILKDYNYLTGYSLAHDWQVNHGKLPQGSRLVPKIPFVAGGSFELANLYALDSKKSMFLRAEIASQIKNLPDGATIELKTT